MARFLRLKKSELEALKKQFIQYLIVHGIEASEWEKLKENQSELAEDYIDQFSDYVQLSALASCQFISRIQGQMIESRHCLTDHMSIVRVQCAGEEIQNCTSLAELLALIESSENKLQYSKTQEDYQDNREDHIYRMIEGGGFRIDHGELYRAAILAWAENQ